MEGGEDIEAIQITDFKNLKKKTKKTKKPKAEEEAAKQEAAEVEKSKVSLKEVEGHDTYDYEELLTRITEIIANKNPDMAGASKKRNGGDPEVARIGTTKSGWLNFGQLCQQIDRPQEHVVLFFSVEFGTECFVNTKEEMILKGRYSQKKIEILWKKYIENMVRCNNCKSYKTKFERDQQTRLYIINCSTCGSTRTAAQVKHGYQAVKRGERKKEKQKAP